MGATRKSLISWLNLQKRYDLRRAEQALGAKIKAIPTLKVV